jgi:hypothetical protein
MKVLRAYEARTVNFGHSHEFNPGTMLFLFKIKRALLELLIERQQLTKLIFLPLPERHEFITNRK